MSGTFCLTQTRTQSSQTIKLELDFMLHLVLWIGRGTALRRWNIMILDSDLSSLGQKINIIQSLDWAEVTLSKHRCRATGKCLFATCIAPLKFKGSINIEDVGLSRPIIISYSDIVSPVINSPEKILATHPICKVQSTYTLFITHPEHLAISYAFISSATCISAIRLLRE